MNTHPSESPSPQPGPHFGPHAGPHQGRLRWHSRRALLELDLLLERFWNRHGDALDVELAVVLEELLRQEDHDLWDMLCGRRDIEDPRWRGLIGLLLEV